jgi:hypothetical protein
MQASIEISCEYMNAAELKKGLEAHQGEKALGYSIELHKKPSGFRGLDQSVLVALVGLASGALGALINGLLQIAAQRRGAYLELHGKDWSIKVPAETSAGELEKMVELAQSNDVQRIKLLSSGL